jgi:hypothetical protein
MKLLLCSVGVSLLALSVATATRAPEDRGSCSFKVSESPAKPSITGPQDIVAMTYVIEQPDSPIEILAADFKDSFLSVVNDRYSEQLRCTIKVRNRSDQPVRGFDTRVQVTTGGYAHAGGGIGTFWPEVGQTGRSLARGEAMEITGCGGSGTGGVIANTVRLIVAVDSVVMDGCFYVPSRRYPDRLPVS